MNNKTFLVQFAGRQRGAIGSFYPILIEVEAADSEVAKEKLFTLCNKYEVNYIIRVDEKPLDAANTLSIK